LAEDQERRDDGVVHYEGGIPVFNTRLDKLEKEANEAKDRDDEYRKKQLQLNSRLVWFTALLAAVGVIGGAISAYQTHIASINAAAAQANAAAAEGMVGEMKKSGNDTHALAEQAGKQADAAKLSADAAKSAAETARKQLDLSERPWVHSEFTPTSLFFKEDGGFLMLNITITNIGHSVAQSISVWTELHLDTITVRSEGEKLCRVPKSPVNKNYHGGLMLFPGERRTLEQPASVGGKEIEKALATGDFKDTHMVEIYLITCIDYRSPLDTKHHQTRRYFTLGRPDPVSPPAMLGVFDPHGTYAPSQFSMTPEPWDDAD
jgi:hypothetical protein